MATIHEKLEDMRRELNLLHRADLTSHIDAIATGLRDPAFAPTEFMVPQNQMSAEQREFLGQEGFIVLDLTFESLVTLREKMNIFISGKINETDEKAPSIVGQIAIRLVDPDYVTSKGKTWEEQKLLKRRGETLGHNLTEIPIPNVATGFQIALKIPKALLTKHHSALPTTRIEGGQVVMSCTYEEPKLKGTIETGISAGLKLPFIGAKYIVVTEGFAEKITKMNSSK